MKTQRLECPHCAAAEHEQFLDLSHTQVAGTSTKVSRGTCRKCHRTYVVTQFVAHEITGNGTGAHSVAKRMREGRARPVLDDPDAPEPED